MITDTENTRQYLFPSQISGGGGVRGYLRTRSLPPMLVGDTIKLLRL